MGGDRNLLERFHSWLRIGKSEPDKRREARLGVHGVVTVLRNAEAGRGSDSPADLVDVSPGGVALRSSVELSIEQAFSVTDGHRVCRCVVRHCDPDEEAFIVGAERVALDELPLDQRERVPISNFQFFRPE